MRATAQIPTSESQLSAGLEATYRLLEKRIETLTGELAAVRAEREAELKAREQLAARLTGILDALPAAVVVLDGNGRISVANPAARELLGIPLEGEAWGTVVGRAFAVDPAGSDLQLANGRRVTLSTRPMGGAPGQILLIHDVTDERRLHERLRHMQRLADMGRMTANLAHQIRTPLASALLYASRLSSGHLPEERREVFAGRTVERLQDLERLVNDMLVFARGDSGRRETVPVVQVVSDALEGLTAKLESEGIAVSVEDQSGDGCWHGNPSLLATAIQNLVSNAAEAVGPRDARIDVVVEPARPDAFEVKVSDNGPGVPDDIIGDLFEPFVTGRSEGTGLGLAVVRSIARSHGGEVWYEPIPDGGALFRFRIPAASEAAPRLRAAGE